MRNRNLHVPPPQFADGELCSECNRPLSIYDPYRTCGPCRCRISSRWAPVRFLFRPVVRRGPLLPETIRDDTMTRGQGPPE